MGQYYKPVNTDNEEWLYSHDYHSGLKLMEHSWMANDFVCTVEGLLAKGCRWFGCSLVWAGDEGISAGEIDYYSQCGDECKNITPKISHEKYSYLVNKSKKTYIDKEEVPKNGVWQIHPLPIMTCIGNGRYGGDLKKERCGGNTELIGSWANDVIEPSNTFPENYEKVVFDLVEK